MAIDNWLANFLESCIYITKKKEEVEEEKKKIEQPDDMKFEAITKYENHES